MWSCSSPSLRGDAERRGATALAHAWISRQSVPIAERRRGDDAYCASKVFFGVVPGSSDTARFPGWTSPKEGQAQTAPLNRQMAGVLSARAGIMRFCTGGKSRRQAGVKRRRWLCLGDVKTTWRPISAQPNLARSRAIGHLSVEALDAAFIRLLSGLQAREVARAQLKRSDLRLGLACAQTRSDGLWRTRASSGVYGFASAGREAQRDESFATIAPGSTRAMPHCNPQVRERWKPAKHRTEAREIRETWWAAKDFG